jgi:hypothetical protein
MAERRHRDVFGIVGDPPDFTALEDTLYAAHRCRPADLSLDSIGAVEGGRANGFEWAHPANQVLDWSIALPADRKDGPKTRASEALVQPMVDRGSRDAEFLSRNRNSAHVSDRCCEPIDLLSIRFLLDAVGRATFSASPCHLQSSHLAKLPLAILIFVDTSLHDVSRLRMWLKVLHSNTEKQNCMFGSMKLIVTTAIGGFVAGFELESAEFRSSQPRPCSYSEAAPQSRA